MIESNICEIKDQNLSAYEKTMISLIISYLQIYPNLGVNEWEKICTDINIRYVLISRFTEQAIEVGNFRCEKIVFDEEEVSICNNWYDYGLLECLVNYNKIIQLIDKIKIGNEHKLLKNNFDTYLSICDLINLINVKSGTFECMRNDKFSREHAPQSFESFKPFEFIQLFKNCLCCDEIYNSHKDLLILAYRILNYQIRTHLNAMFLIVALQILKSSQFLKKEVSIIAKSLYDDLHKLLKDARVINVMYNNHHIDLDIQSEKRGRKKNTTRLQIIYGYDNYDIYGLRLDTAHKGVKYFHFNNVSPNEVEYYPIEESEYNNIIKQIPTAEECFINFNHLWFVKENYQNKLKSVDLILFREQMKTQKHKDVFSDDIIETDIIRFFEAIYNFVYLQFTQQVDYDGKSEKLLFRFDKLMFYSNIYFIGAYSNEDSEMLNKVSDFIIEKAQTFELIEIEDANWLKFEKPTDVIECIIDISKEKALK